MTNRWPFTLGDSAGDTIIKASELSGSTLFVAGTSSATDIKHASASVSVFAASISTSTIGGSINWIKRVVDSSNPGSGKITDVHQMLLVGSEIVLMVSGTASSDYFFEMISQNDGSFVI